MAALSNPTTYGTRKYSSWCPDIHGPKDPESKTPKNLAFRKIPKVPRIPKISKNTKFQKYKIPKIQNSKKYKIPKDTKFQKIQNSKKYKISNSKKSKNPKFCHIYEILQKGLDSWELRICGSVYTWAPRRAFPRVARGLSIYIYLSICTYTCIHL